MSQNAESPQEQNISDQRPNLGMAGAGNGAAEILRRGKKGGRRGASASEDSGPSLEGYVQLEIPGSSSGLQRDLTTPPNTSRSSTIVTGGTTSGASSFPVSATQTGDSLNPNAGNFIPMRVNANAMPANNPFHVQQLADSLEQEPNVRPNLSNVQGMHRNNMNPLPQQFESSPALDSMKQSLFDGTAWWQQLNDQQRASST